MLLHPTLRVSAVPEVTPTLLERHHLRAVMVDLDDTLLASTVSHLALTDELLAWRETLRVAGIGLLILSNGEAKRVARCAALLDAPGLSMSGKPFFWAFRRGLARLESKANETAMIGDQLFTDVFGANLMGLTSILVSPLSLGKLPHTRLARRLERAILKGVPYGRP